MFTAAAAVAWVVAVAAEWVSPMWAAAVGGPMLMLLGGVEAASKAD